MFLNTEDLRADSSRGIVVSTKDGRQVSFSGGDYSLRTDSLRGEAITGRGKVFRDRQPQFVAFEGTIPSSDVDKITAVKSNILLYVFLGTTAVVVAIALAMRSFPSLGG